VANSMRPFLRHLLPKPLRREWFAYFREATGWTTAAKK
jgi:hypothetical protein